MTIHIRTTLTALAVVGAMAIPVRGDDGRRAFRAEMSPAERNVYRAQVVRERLTAAADGPGTDPR